MRSKIRACCGIVIVLATLLLTVDSSDSGAASKPSVGAVAEGLTCQCGCGLTVANCNHPQCEFSVPVRDQIEKMIADGRSREQIITMFRVKYGEKILSAPTTTGFNLLAWVMPFGVIVGGGGLLLAVLSRWRGKRRGSAPSNERAEFFDPELRRRLEDELREDA